MKAAHRARKWSVLLVVLILLPMSASAVVVKGLYKAQVNVAGQSAGQLQAAYARGLRQVLLRVSGSREVLEDSKLKSLLDNAESLLQSYQYQTVRYGSDRLLMTFGAVAVNRALASMNAPVWGANRPLMLSWIAVDSGRDRYLVTTGGDSGKQGLWASEFASAAAVRGLPLNLPRADATGQRGLLSEIRGQFMEKIRQASSSYAHNLLSVVNVTRRNGKWEARWQLSGPGFSESDEVLNAASSADLAAQIVRGWADLLAGRYAVAAGDVSEAQRVDLIIDNVSSVKAYGAIMGSLDHMTPVMDAGPYRVTSDSARIRVAFSGELSVLKDYIALDDRLEAVAEATTDIPAKSSPATGDSQQAPSAATGTTKASEREADDTAQADADQLQYKPAAKADDNASSDDQERDTEEQFESLYPVLHYRWHGDSVVRQDGK